MAFDNSENMSISFVWWGKIIFCPFEKRKEMTKETKQKQTLLLLFTVSIKKTKMHFLAFWKK